MRMIKKGDRVKAFLDARICGIVEEIVYNKAQGYMMLEGVPSAEAFARIKLSNGATVNVKTTELFIES